MIDFKNKDEMTTNVVICGSLAVFLIAGACMVLLPKPAGPNPQANKIALRRIDAATDAMTEKIKSAAKDLGAYTWTGNQEEIGPVVLKQVNGLLQNRRLKLAGFHAEKSIEEPNITLVPFVISVDGAFTNVMSFARDLEKPGTKLVVNLFQVSNADQSTDKVTASIGITTYQIPPGLTDVGTTSRSATPAKGKGTDSPADKTAPAKTAPTHTAKGVKKNA